MKLKKRHISLLVFCAYMAAVAYVCFARPESIPELKPDLFGIPIDKVLHFILFLPYPVLAYIAFRTDNKGMRTHLTTLVTILIIGICLAMGTEKIQGMSEYRSFEIEDFYADVTGMVLSTVSTAAWIIIKRRRNIPETK